MIKSDSLAKLAPALLKAQKKMGAALKDSKNPFFKSKFADLNSVIDACVPVLNEEGIAVLQTVSADAVETVLLHESGEYVMSATPIVVAKQSDPQALGSAISYARRYGLQAMPVLKAEDDDGEKAMGRRTGYSEIAPPAALTTIIPASTTQASNDVPKKTVSFSKKALTAVKPEGDL